MLLQVSGSQEGAGVKILPWELDNLLGFDPTTVYKLKALQVDNLGKRTHVINTDLILNYFYATSKFSST